MCEAVNRGGFRGTFTVAVSQSSCSLLTALSFVSQVS